MWPLPASIGIQEMGAIYTDRELMDFFDYLYYLLQDGVKQYRSTNRNLSSAFSKISDHVGSPTVKRSPQQSSFRRDLTIICEAATIVDARVVFTDDQRFIADLLEHEEVYDCLVKAIQRVFNINYTLHILALHTLIPLID